MQFKQLSKYIIIGLTFLITLTSVSYGSTQTAKKEYPENGPYQHLKALRGMQR